MFHFIGGAKLIVSLVVACSLTITPALAEPVKTVDYMALVNPYANSDEEPDISTEAGVREMALDSRFEKCRNNVYSTVAHAHKIQVFSESSDIMMPKEKYYKMSVRSRNVEYPFTPNDLATDSKVAPIKLMLDIAWHNPGKGDSHAEKVSAMYWQQCLKLSLSPFETDYRNIDESDYEDESEDEDERQ